MVVIIVDDNRFQNLSIEMAFELLIVIALIILFIVSLCSLLQKIRKAYDHENEARRRITDSQIYSVDLPPSYDNEVAQSQGIHPGEFSPPSYSEYYEPPPKYDDAIKSNRTVISQEIPAVHQTPTTQSQNQNLTSVMTQS